MIGSVRSCKKNEKNRLLSKWRVTARECSIEGSKCSRAWITKRWQVVEKANGFWPSLEMGWNLRIQKFCCNCTEWQRGLVGNSVYSFGPLSKNGCRNFGGSTNKIYQAIPGMRGLSHKGRLNSLGVYSLGV